jgi:hypothetical protein
VNTLTWSARKIHRRATDAMVWHYTLLASSFLYTGRGTLGSGLTGYSLAGEKEVSTATATSPSRACSR